MSILTNYLTGIILLTLLINMGCDAQVPSVSVDSLQSLLLSDSTTVLVDVRNENEFVGTMNKIDEAIHIPLGQLEDRISELDQYRGKAVYFICRSGNRSGYATQMLIDKGFKAFNVSGGMLAYSKKFRTEE